MRFFLFCLFTLAFGQTKAQQTPYTLFYRNNWQFVNPAAIDRAHYLTNNPQPTVLNFGSRAQWIGLDGAPLFYYASAEYCPVRHQTQPHHKFGVTGFGDQTDALGTYGFYGTYSYYFPLGRSRGKVLHIGFSPGFIWSNLNTNKLRGEPGTSPLQDPTVANNENRGYFDFAFGAMYRYRDVFYVGVSVPQTFGLNIAQSGDEKNKKSVFKTQRVQHFNVHCGWFIRTGTVDAMNANSEETFWTLEPSLWARVVPRITYSTLLPGKSYPISVDVNFRAHYRQKYWFGGGLSTNGVANAELGFKALVNETALKIGLGYGLPLLRQQLRLGHSVELTTSMSFD